MACVFTIAVSTQKKTEGVEIVSDECEAKFEPNLRVNDFDEECVGNECIEPKNNEIRCEKSVDEKECETDCEVALQTTEKETETVKESVESVATIPAYLVDGALLDSELNEYLYERLCEHGLEWFQPIALCQMYQESRFDSKAENSNGLDKGILQFRITYWDEISSQYGKAGANIFDPYAQIYVYVERINEWYCGGFTESYIISNHYTGCAGFSSQYVSDVTQWVELTRRFNG